MQASHRLQAILDRYTRNVPDATHAAVSALSSAVFDALAEPGTGRWPQIDSQWGVHPYATDTSVKTWSQRDESSGTTIRIVLTNESTYSGYVEHGYTRAGAGTAMPWLARGAEPYALTAAQAVVKEFAPEFARIFATELKHG